ncbi:hypothetical protein [Streptomyces sp. OV198]|jgi:hypothetical protein|uniref:hypothetical protein n=1 Tax=Streptomyces sp. OV198 TaxID=1882787 RepID=UPI0015CF73D8|nr:hypothetical protein [Streptomyces sp. OV198]
MPSAEQPTHAPKDDQPEPVLRPQDEPVPAKEPSDAECVTTIRSGRAGADDDAEYEPL